MLLIHGWGADSSVWSGQSELEAAFEYSLHVTLPGYSGAGEESDKWATPDLSPGVRAILDNAPPDGPDDGPLTAVGWSLGAMALIEAAIEAPERFSAIVLVGASPSFVKRKDFPWGQKPSVVRRMVKELGSGTEDAIKRFQPLIFTDEERASLEVKELLGQMWRFRCDPLSLENGLMALINTDLRDKLALIKTKTLVVHGTLDAVCDVECGRYLAGNIAGAKLAIMDGAGHAPFITRPNEFNSIVTDFLENI